MDYKKHCRLINDYELEYTNRGKGNPQYSYEFVKEFDKVFANLVSVEKIELLGGTPGGYDVETLISFLEEYSAPIKLRDDEVVSLRDLSVLHNRYDAKCAELCKHLKDWRAMQQEQAAGNVSVPVTDMERGM